ncbi:MULTISPECIES: glutamate racemase [unclassified Treponema]|uniref:glutamate racemase n=1 Tax=unclassified Treponema TaxID=2638727 RepID=UPI0020A5601A|nr:MULTISPECIES: glutamate racemase [unclassified Treponema]UTC68180.1 glutamate racemase [Treponema sp. OMZ 789]UTC70900.1 glutamate racemase [Treponema sp. OMZ 790]UTC73640.1 glutamate racemase [Treponema sp. OMZ 791]
MTKEKNIQYVFIDSGIGGLPYLRHLKEIEPQSSCAYVADTKHFPYGEKTLEEVIEYTQNLVKKIIEELRPSVIIIACNTMTVSALSHLREKFDIPFVGTVPAIKPAVLASKNKKIAVLATERTVNDIYVQNLIDEFGADCKFFMRADSVLVSKIENSLLSGSEEDKKAAIRPAVEFFKSAGTDTAVLGCTHFLHLRDEFKAVCEPDIRIVDSLDGVVNRALKISPPQKLKKENSKLKNIQKDIFYITSEKTEENTKKYSAYADLFGMVLGYF